jgi:hypothetical protein
MSFRPLTTLLRHILAGAVTVAACLVIWTIIYLALLAWALLTNSGLGGPFAYPVGLLAILLSATAACALIFFPATLLSEFICRRRSFPPVLAGIPLSCLNTTVIVFVIVCGAVAISPPPDELSVFAATGLTTATLLVPLGIYWWTSQFPSLTTRLYHKLRGTPQLTENQSSIQS